jgi:hypothetical protein
MTKPIIRIHNTELDEIIDREMTDEEYEQFLADKAESDAKQAEAEAKAEAKAALLERLGVTEEEAKLLLG